MALIRIFLSIVVVAAPLFADWSLQFDGKRGEAHGSLKKSRSSVGPMRLEFRIHDFDPAAVSEGRMMVVCSQIFYRQAGSPLLFHTNWLTSNGQWGALNLTGRKDVIIRVQHRLDAGITEYEMWNSDGSSYTRDAAPGRTEVKNCGDQDIWFGAVDQKMFARFGLAYFRWFDTLVATGSGPSDGPEGAFVAYEFEESEVETTGHAGKLAVQGTTYTATTVHPRLVSAGEDRTVRRNEVIRLDWGSGSPASGSTWRWEQVRGPVALQIAEPDRPVTTATGASQPGTYEFRLTFTDRNRRSASGTVRVGVRNDNEQGVILVDDPNVSFVLGPMLGHGSSPWKWYDDTRLVMGKKWAPEYTAIPGVSKERQGSVTLTKGSALVRGTDTKFVDDFLQPLNSGKGAIALSTGSRVGKGVGTAFLSTFLTEPKAGGRIRLQGTVARLEGAPAAALGPRQSILIRGAGNQWRAYRIARAIDGATFELETPYDGPAMPGPVPFQIAGDRGVVLVVTDAGNRRWVFEPNVIGDTELVLPVEFNGQAGAALPYTTSSYLPGGGALIARYGVSPGATQVGYRDLAVAKVLSDTELTMYGPYPLETASGVKFGRATGEETGYWAEGVNYYDSILVHYQNYYRTGDDIYREYARTLADSWWTFYDSGRIEPAGIPPRRVNLAGLILRAMDGRPEFWPWITRYVDFHYPVWLGLRRDNDGLWFGTREGGYMLYYAALLAKTHPDPNVRSAYLAKATDISIHYFGRLQLADGSWRWLEELWKGHGEQPFHVGLLLEGLIATHRLTHNPEILQIIKKSVDHLIAIQQPAPCRSPVYAIYNDDGPWGLVCRTSKDRPTVDEILDSRAGNNTIVHALGYLWVMTGNQVYRQVGDDMFAATFGAGQGPGSDEWKGRADTTSKQYGQSFRSSGAYLVYRLYSPGGPAIPGL